MTKQKILVIGTGGTIGAKAGSTITADAPLKILNLYTPPAGVDLIGRTAFDRFSEHADLAYLEQLCTYMQGIDYSAYRGVVLLHGSDTLTYTAALLAHLLPDKPLVLVAAGTPPEAPGSNALPNLNLAVQYLLSGAKDGVQIAYDGLHPAWATTEADCNDRFHHASVPFVPVQAPAFHRRRILQITPHPGIDYGAFDLTGVDAVHVPQCYRTGAGDRICPSLQESWRTLSLCDPKARCRLCNRRSPAGHLDKHHPGERLCKIVIDKRAGL